MDPVLAAKRLIDSLVEEELETSNTLSEAQEQEDEGEEEEDDEEENTPKSNPAPAAGGASQNQSSVAMKPAAFGKGASGDLVHDAHGGGVKDAHGGSDSLQTMQYTDMSAQNRASVSMKPSFATGGAATGMSEQQVRADITAIFGSEDLSEEFMSKAGSIYEAAVLAKAEEVIVKIHEQYESTLAEEVESIKNDLTEKVDSYLNYVVDEWMNENKLAIENGIRTEIAESFIAKLKDLFIESYIEVPQNKTNLFDEMAETIETLETRVNEEVSRNVQLVNEAKAARAVGIFTEVTKNLTDGEIDRVSKLAENLEFESEDDFRDKIETIVENIKRVPTIKENKSQKLNNNKYLVEETIIEEDTTEQTIDDPFIQLYANILTRTVNK